MEANTSYISPEALLSRILPLLDDQRMEFLPKGFYMQSIKDAFNDLALDTFFDERHESFPFPAGNLVMKLPEGAFNIKKVYIFNGEKCDINTATKVWWKRNYYTRGSGYVADDRWQNGNDPFYASHTTKNMADKSMIRQNRAPNQLYFYNIEGGNIMFSPSCLGFQKVMLNYHGLGVTTIDDIPLIPLIFRRAIEDFVCEFILRVRMAKDPSAGWRQLWAVYDKRLNQEFDGSWDKAKQLVKNMHQSQRDEMAEYLGRSQW